MPDPKAGEREACARPQGHRPGKRTELCAAADREAAHSRESQAEISCVLPREQEGGGGAPENVPQGTCVPAAGGDVLGGGGAGPSARASGAGPAGESLGDPQLLPCL